MASLLQSLRETNRRLSLWLDGMPTGDGSVSATPERMSALLSELLSAGMALREKPFPLDCGDAALEQELDRYRSQVERLRDMLPSIHRQLLAERARIESERARLQAATAWARGSRQTL